MQTQREIEFSHGRSQHPGYATRPEDIRHLRETLHPETHVKTSGGIKTYEQAQALIDAGAELLGTSAAIAIVEGSTKE